MWLEGDKCLPAFDKSREKLGFRIGRQPLVHPKLPIFLPFRAVFRVIQLSLTND